MHDPEDTVMAALRAARPQLPDDAASPVSPAAASLLEGILADEGRHAAGRIPAMDGTRPLFAVRVPARRWPVRAIVTATAAAAVVATVVVVAPETTPPRPPAPGGGGETVARVLDPDEVRLITASSAAALGGTGRAEVAFVSGAGSLAEQRGVARIAYAGNDLDMALRFEGTHGRPGFDAANRTVDGRFYLYDGPPGAERWYHDVAVGPASGRDLFTVDPRTLLAAVRPEAELTELGAEAVDGVTVTHLRAARPQALGTLNLGLGPLEGQALTAFDVWVGPDGVVRRLDLALEQVQPPAAGGADTRWMVKNPDGTVTHTSAPPGMEGDGRTTVHRSRYSARFFDLGAPITIVAPSDAVPVAGKG